MERLSLVPLTSINVEDTPHLTPLCNDASTMRLYYDYPLCRDSACQGDCAGGCEGSARGDYNYGTLCSDGSSRGDCVGAYEGAISGFHW